MKIQYLGHAAFRLISHAGTTIVCDPFSDELVGFSMANLRADIVTTSHNHRDHNFVDGVRGEPTILDCQCSVLADDVCIESFKSFHDNQKGKKRGENLIFKFLIDGISVAHMGDIGEVSTDVVSKLQGVDILLVPVGGYYTIDAKQAKEYVNILNPKIVIPMHFQTEDGKILEIDKVDEFLNLFNQSAVEHFDFETLNIVDKPQGKSTKVIVLKRFED